MSKKRLANLRRLRIAATGAPASNVWAFDRSGTTSTDSSPGTLRGYAACISREAGRADASRRVLRLAQSNQAAHQLLSWRVSIARRVVSPSSWIAWRWRLRDQLWIHSSSERAASRRKSPSTESTPAQMFRRNDCPLVRGSIAERPDGELVCVTTLPGGEQASL